MPLAFLLALVYWSVPIAMVFPPSALTVVNRDHNQSAVIAVPSYDSGLVRGDNKEFGGTIAFNPTYLVTPSRNSSVLRIMDG